MINFFGQLLSPVLTMPTLNILALIYHWVGDFGLAIVVYSVLFQVFLWPLAILGMRAQQRFQQSMVIFKERVEKLKQQYPNEPKQVQAHMKECADGLTINPLGSFVPLLLQVPFIIGLFYALRTV